MVRPSTFFYADSLQAAHSFRLAAVEYERIIFEHPGGVAAARAALEKARCEKMLGRYGKAADVLETVMLQGLPDSLQYPILFEGVVSAYLAHEPSRAYQRQQVLVHFFPDSAESHDLLLMKILSLNEMRRWHEADTVYRHYQQFWAGGYMVRADPYRHMPRLKDPEKAEKLSAYLPFTGAGLFYADDVSEGVLNVALQIGFIAFGAYSVLMERYIIGALIGVGGYAAFYHGGVRRAKAYTMLRNERVSLQFNTRVRKLLLRQDITEMSYPKESR